jgi:alkylation response protein AidB-like acyl-CoA dehydrogenase
VSRIDDLRPDVPEVVRRIADDVLFPAALATEAARLVPVALLDELAAAGLYGMAGPVEIGGMGLDIQTACNAIEVLAGACLSTAFVWLQHQGSVLSVAFTGSESLRSAWLGPLCQGTKRAGVALGGVLPGPPQLRVRQSSSGWILDGTSPWVTGWGLVDVLRVAARDADDNLVNLLMDATPAPSLRVESRPMVSMNATGTVTLHFDGHPVPADRLLGSEPYAGFAASDAGALRINGSLSLGVAARCCALMDPSPLDDQVAACRKALDEGTPDTFPAARAAAADLAMRAAQALVVATGSRSILTDHHPQRLAREALFLQVFGQRPTIRTALLSRLTGA